MTTFVVPPTERTPWPTLGPGVCDFIEAYLVHGPGDIKGKPAILDDETRALIYRTYEVYPRGHPQAGRRRFKRAAWSLRKGTAKTEKAMWIAACELHPDAPVRCDGWRKAGRRWEPVGRGVNDPYIPLVAYTEEQTEELAFGALYVILSESPLVADFDIGLDRILVLDERGRANGKAVPLAGAPNSRDGARTTFQHFDETHRMTLQRLRDAHQTMLGNLPKRKLSDAWSLETTTAFTPGQGSVAESTWRYAEKVAKRQVDDPRLFFFHRQASDRHDLTTEKGARAAVIEASGPSAAWSDIDSVIERWADPTTDLAYWERVWTNRPKQSVSQGFDVDRWDQLVDAEAVVADDTLVTLGFAGQRTAAAALVATVVATGHQFVVEMFERPANVNSWEVPADKLDIAVARAFGTWRVWRLYAATPTSLDTAVDRWAGQYDARAGAEKRRIISWPINQNRMGLATKGFANAVATGEQSHDGNAVLRSHVGHVRRRALTKIDPETGQSLWVPAKERDDSAKAIVGTIAAILSWEARGDAIAAKALEEEGVGEFYSF